MEITKVKVQDYKTKKQDYKTKKQDSKQQFTIFFNQSK